MISLYKFFLSICFDIYEVWNSKTVFNLWLINVFNHQSNDICSQVDNVSQVRQLDREWRSVLIWSWLGAFQLIFVTGFFNNYNKKCNFYNKTRVSFKMITAYKGYEVMFLSFWESDCQKMQMATFRPMHLPWRSEERRVGTESRSRWSPYH